MEEATPEVCTEIGRFFVEFSRMEAALDEAVLAILKLDEHPAKLVVVAPMDFAKKANLVKTAVESATSGNGLDFPCWMEGRRL